MAPHVGAAIIKGIAEGCIASGCALIGGETAEMPGLYAKGDYDLAGFAVGAAERGHLLPKSGIKPGDRLIGLPSSGAHSNGFSLVRKIVEVSKLAWTDAAPFALGKTLGDALLEPTRLYVKPMLQALKATDAIKAMAHITGGGFPDNIPRVLPDGISANIQLSAIKVPPVFSWLAKTGGVAQDEMLRTFNCGIGMIVVVDAAKAQEAITVLREAGEAAVDVGDITEAVAGQPRVTYFGALAL